MPRPGIRTAEIKLRVTPALKVLAEQLATQQHRTLTNLLEHLIAEEARRAGLAVPGDG